MRRRNVDKTKNYLALPCVFVFSCVLLLSIGWAAFQSTFNIKNLYATVRVDRDIRVTGVQAISNTNSGRSNYEEYNVSSIYSTAYLPNQNSTVTYRVEVTNVGNVKAGIYSVGEIYKIINSNIDSDLEIKSTTLVLKETLCDVRSVATFDVVIGYKTNGYDGSHNTHLVTIYFDFRRVFDINYYGFGNTSGLDDEMMDGDTKTITFNSTTGIPANTTTTGATGSYNSNTNTLTLSNITASGLNDTINVSRHFGITYSGFTGSNVSSLPSSIIYSGGTIQIPNGVDYPDSVTITGATGSYNDQTHVITINNNISSNITITATYSSGNTVVVVNPDGTTTTTTTTENQNGSTTISAVTTDSNGTPITSSTTTTNYDSNGNPTTSTTTTTNYDSNGNPDTGSTANTDINGNINTQNVTYDNNNNPVVTGYTIDTTNNSSGGESISAGLDTGMLVFDGHDWEATLVATIDMDNITSTSGIYPIINCSAKDPSDNKLDGVILYARKAGGTVYNESVSSVSASTSNPAMRFKINKYNDGSTPTSDSVDFYSSKSTAWSSYGFGTKTKPVTLTFYLECTNNIISANIQYNNNVVARPRYQRTYGFTAGLDGITFELGTFTSAGANSQPTHFPFIVKSFDVHKK